MQTKWRYFLKTLGNPEIPFGQVVASIGQFLAPIWDAIVAENERAASWIASQAKWS